MIDMAELAASTPQGPTDRARTPLRSLVENRFRLALRRRELSKKAPLYCLLYCAMQ